MTVSLKKGGNVSLTKESPSLEEVLVGLGWDARETDGYDFDLDASCFMLTYFIPLICRLPVCCRPLL